MKTASGLIEYCKTQLGKPYWYGTFGQIATQALLDYNKSRLPSYYTANDFKSQIGKRVHDCVGLIKGYLWSDSPTSIPQYGKNYPDISADQMRTKCTEQGPIETIPEIPGLLLFYSGHVGVYIGNGQAIEARGHAYGVVQTTVNSRSWRYWGKLDYLEYDTEVKSMICDISDCEVKYIKPNMMLSSWYSKQTDKPYALINASLYESVSVPVGTIIENRKIVHDAGNGQGIGIVNNKLQFGNPWSYTYDYYLTGYNCPVQNGKYVAPTFNDSYVFPNKLNRIGLGKKNNKWYIITVDKITLKGFADYAIQNGFDTLVNLDGGGSRFLMYDGKKYYTSTRTPYNALAFYKGSAPKIVCPYKTPTVNVKYGAKGDNARWVQWYLVQLGYDIGKWGIDGDFGTASVAALIKFQKDYGFTDKDVDGICGKNTREALIKTLASKK